jgi:hypothetical protein
MVFPEDVIGAAILAEKADSGEDASSPAVEFTNRMTKRNDFFHARTLAWMSW